MEERQLKVNNITITYYDEGLREWPVIIFIHGFPFNKSTWTSQIEALKGNFRVIAYDVRGHGNTSSGNTDFSIELFTQDLILFMDALKLDKTALCGLSMGGYIALNAIENHPERFEALVLCDTQCIADGAEAKENRLKTIESIKQKGVENYADKNIKNFFSPESLTTNQKEIALVREIIMKTSQETLCSTLLALSHRKETCSKLYKIDVPVLIIVGKDDKITPPGQAQVMHEKIRDSSLSVIKHAGHLTNIENPREFNYQLKRYHYEYL